MKSRRVVTSHEKRIMDSAIQKQIAEYDRKHAIEISALILWCLHEEFGFGLERLKRFYDCFDRDIKALVDRYELDNSDDIWLCTHKLKEYGIDLEQWAKEEL